MFIMQHPCDNVSDVTCVLLDMAPAVRNMFNQVEILTRLLLVVPASSAEAERIFSALRRLKTWLRSTVSQARLNLLAPLNCHSDVLDQLNLSELVREFIG